MSTKWTGLDPSVRLIGGALALLLLAGGCGSCQQTTEAPATSSEGEGGKVRGGEPAPGAPVTEGKIGMPTAAAGEADESDSEGEGNCTVIIDAEPDYGEPPLTVHFSVDADCGSGTPTYDWDFGDNSPHGAVAAPVHIYEKAGDYTVTLKATGPGGANGSDEIDITVEEADGAH
jgi:hypothetical protein